jgi:ribosome-binding factor A
MSRPQKRYPRTARLNESVLEVLAEELERMNDPRLDLVTFTGVDVRRDLSHATVYFSTLGATTTGESESYRTDVEAALGSAAPHLRGVLGRQLRIRQVPKLNFAEDHGIASGQRIEAILREIHHESPAEDEAGDTGGEGEEV